MSDERFEELGIPRRRFLKRSAAAAFVAPAVVSFALDGVAEGDTAHRNGTFTDQRCANQSFPNQAYVEDSLVSVIRGALLGVPACDISHAEAKKIGQLAYDAAWAAAVDSSDMCGEIKELISEINKLNKPGLKSELLYYARQARITAGC